MDILAYARWYTSHGFSVIPVKADGSKSPALTGWRKYSNEIASDDILVEWFGKAEPIGIGVPAGPASGNLVVLDFEFKDGESSYFEWLNRLPHELKLHALAVPTVTTPSGGKHLWVRLPEPQPGCKLARYSNGKTKIEVRGEGHQVLAPGCPLECHRTNGAVTGKLYEWSREPDPSAFGEVDPDLWVEFCEWACACNEYQPQEQPRDREIRTGAPAGMDSPGNDFNLRGSWDETGLFEAGWTWHRQIGEGKGFLTRPGKDTGISASVGMVSSRERGYPYLYVWSTSTDLASETPYSRFAVYAHLKHKGDYSAAAKELHRLGYGERMEMSAKSRVDFSNLRRADGSPLFTAAIAVVNEGPPIEKPEDEDGSPRMFKWMSELSEQEAEARWIWEGYLARNGITLFSALWKAGKSTLLSHLLKALDGSQSEFLGMPVVPSRVLYITEEDESIWADRRNALLINDHVGMICRPFKMRPTMQEWKDFLNRIQHEVERYRFDLVVFDTLSKMWPVREENDAGQVEEALMPIWTVSQNGTSVLLVHHNRKSGGEHFVGSRGSGGLPAFCEILVEFGYLGNDQRDRKRIIRGRGRYSQTPAEWLIELGPDGKYFSHGDPQDSDVRAAMGTIRLEDEIRATFEDVGEEWLTADEIATETVARRQDKAATEEERQKVTGIRRSDLLALLRKWFEDGELERQGEGRKGSPYEYRLP